MNFKKKAMLNNPENIEVPLSEFIFDVELDSDERWDGETHSGYSYEEAFESFANRLQPILNEHGNKDRVKSITITLKE